MKEQPNCAICDSTLTVTWTDTHGVAACIRCGLPYRILHYDEDNNRLDKGPEPAIKKEWIAIGKRYWEETQRRTFPAAYDFLPRGRRSYSGASHGDVTAFNTWLEAHKDELPAEPDQ